MRIQRERLARKAEHRKTSVRRLDRAGGVTEKVPVRPPRRINWEIISSLAAVVISIFTLYEMKTDRAAAYRPDLSIADTVIAIAWDENGIAATPSESAAERILRYAESEDVINTTVPLKIYNIGVGTAKDITLSWAHEDNLKSIEACFDDYGGIEITTCSTCGEVFGTVHGFPPDIIRYDFMLNAADTYNTIYLPQLYLDFLVQYASRATILDGYPTLTLTANYTDVQGTQYSQEITMTYELITGSWGEENYCVFNLHFTEA